MHSRPFGISRCGHPVVRIRDIGAKNVWLDSRFRIVIETIRVSSVKSNPGFHSKLENFSTAPVMVRGEGRRGNAKPEPEPQGA